MKNNKMVIAVDKGFDYIEKMSYGSYDFYVGSNLVMRCITEGLLKDLLQYTIKVTHGKIRVIQSHEFPSEIYVILDE